MGFSIQYGLGNVAMISGTDVDGNTGTMVLDTTQWDEVRALLQSKQDVKDFNDAVLEWAAPVIAVADEIKARKEGAGNPVPKIVIEEAVEGVQGRPEFSIEPDLHTTIITLVEEDRTDLLRWINSEQLLVLRP